jgi:hypothetical protein
LQELLHQLGELYMLRFIVSVGLVLFSAAPALADITYEYNDTPIADQALKLLPPGTVVEILDWAHQESATKEKVIKSEITANSETGDGGFAITVNEEPLDLAYAYVVYGSGKKWTNIGWIVKCQSDDILQEVPEYLPDTAIVD